jgi:predicted RNA-binding Zn-ribbon protein involved in translation (DUF1610 family)
MGDMQTNRSCPKCGSEMEIGFLLDSSYTNSLPTLWVKGPPERSFWRLTKIRGKAIRRLESYRCLNCGFLESYALSEWRGWPGS